ncbi:MAG: sensor histidine kinase [Bacteroidia bacterium]
MKKLSCKHRVLYNLLNCFSIFFLPLYTFPQHFNFKNISINEGLQSSLVYGQQEDLNGYLWFATDKGLSQFDGLNFKLLNKNDGLSEIGVFQIAKDSKNLVWFVSTNFKLFFFENNELKAVETKEKICWIDIDIEGKPWFLSRSGAFFFINSNSKLVKVFDPAEIGVTYYNLKSLGNNEFFLSNDNEVFIVTNNKSKIKINLPISVNKNHIVSRCFLKRDGNLLISNHEGIYEFNRKKSKPLSLLFKINQNQIFCFYEDILSNDLWVGTMKGAFQFKNGLISEISKFEYLTDNIILNITKLHDNTWWLCTSENGVYHSNLMAHHFDKSDGLKKNTVSFIKKDGDDIFAISQDRTISLIENNKINRFNKTIPFTERSFGAAVSDAFQTKNDGIFFVTSTLFQIKNRILKKYSISNYNEIIYHFPQNDLTNLYTITKLGLRKGVVKPKLLFNSTPLWIKMKKEYPRLPPVYFGDHDSVYHVYTKSKNGLMELLVNKKIAYYKKINFPYKIQDVWMTSNKSLIIGTLDKGLCILKNNIQKFYSTDDGLLSNYCTKSYYINNKIWICSNKGVSRLELDKNDSLVAISNFTSNDLLIYNEVNDLLVHKGDVYVATNKGVSVFPENIKLATTKPKVFIENVIINNKVKSVSKEYNLLYTENNIAIQYKSISFRSANNIFYKYKIVSDNDSSLVTTKSDRIQLSTLSPGKYVFYVWARNIDGVWSDEPAKIIFIISPPFWQTWWFYSSIMVVLSTIVLFVIRNRVKVFKAKNETEKRIIDAELKAIRLHMNPHFIFNTLSSLQYYIIYNKNKEAGKYLSTFSILLRLIMKYAKQNEIYLKEEIELLDKYVELEQMRFENKIDYVLNVNDDLLYHLIPPLILQPFVENAIKYGISNIKGKGKLEINIYKENMFLVCTIHDNGIGRAQSELLKDDENLKFESTGIKYTRERLRLLSNQKDGENLVVITDLYEKDIAKGTIVKINIPIN